MENLFPPPASINLETGVISDAAKVITRRLSDMPDHYQDRSAVKKLMPSDPVLYRVYMPKQPSEEIGLYTATSVIEPGRVGDEFYMTKGHFHVEAAAPEIYLTLKGNGMLVLQTKKGHSETQAMAAGEINYIPGTWAHRTVNTGATPLIFFAVWPISAGHDYASIDQTGFRLRIMAGQQGPRVVPG